MRTDYKYQRNLNIYQEYANSKISLNALAKQYNLSPQRVKFIVDDYKSKELGQQLQLNDSKEKRESYKNDAVVKRENGKLTLSLKMLDELIKWDELNENPRGKMDVLGHKKIALTLMADKTNNKQSKLALLAEARKCIEEAISISQTNPEIPSGPVAIQQVHIANLMLKEAVLTNSDTLLLTNALTTIDNAITNLPGSQAHKSWPLVTKARILYALHKTEEALDTLSQAQKQLYLGYDEELTWAKTRITKEKSDAKLNLVGADQAKIKLRIWSSGINECLAEIYEQEHKDILAEIYATAVLKTYDPDKILKSRKAHAAQILKNIKKRH